MAAVITDLGGGLLMGHGRITSDLTRHHTVTHILHVTDDGEKAASRDESPDGDSSTTRYGDDQTLEHLTLDLSDPQGFTSTAEKAVAFVRSAMEADSVVLVRSAVDSHATALMTAVLMLLHGWSLSTAWTHVISRNDCSLREEGRHALLVFEVATCGSPSMVEDEKAQKLTKLANDYVDTVSEASETDEDASSSSDSEDDQIDTTRKQASKEVPASAAEELRAPAAEEVCPAVAASTDAGDVPSSTLVCDRCDGPHLSEECPYFTKPREAPPAAGEVRYDNDAEMFTFSCPHCKELITVREGDLACRTFRHAVPNPDANQPGRKGRLVGGFANPHAPRDECERWVREGLIFGCGKPFKFDGKKVEKCGYV